MAYKSLYQALKQTITKMGRENILNLFVADVRVPEQLMRAMAAEAEAARLANAKVVAAEGEHRASRSLHLAANNINNRPAALQVTIV